MAKMQVKGLDRLNDKLVWMAGAGKRIGKMAVYDGARVVTDEVRSELRRLNVNEPGKPADPRKKYRSLTALEKQDLEKGLGIATIRIEGSEVSTVIGFAGYGRRSTRAYPRGLPNALLARSIAKPSELRKGRRFTRIALKNVESKAVSAMVATGEREIAKIIAE